MATIRLRTNYNVVRVMDVISISVIILRKRVANHHNNIRWQIINII